MAYKAIVYNVMIASPSDVEEEREIIRKIVLEWNYKNSVSSEMVLMPLGWETHSAPFLGEEDDRRGQAVINNMVLKHADLLVAIFKSRIGTPTGKAPSGTIEEIDFHRGLGKPVLRYFRKQKIGIRTLADAILRRKATKQEQEVLVYKEQCMKDGLIFEYCDCAKLKEKFYGDLQIAANRLKEMKKLEPILQEPTRGISGKSLAIIDDSVPVISEKIKTFVVDAVKDPKGQMSVIRLSGQPIIVKTNGKEYPEYEDIILQLEEMRWIKKIDAEGVLYALTDLGFQEVAKINLQ